MKKLRHYFSLFLAFSTCSILTLNAQDNVGIGTSSPHNSALLDLTSTNKGLLIPRVTLVAATNGTSPVSAPATGLLVYNTGGTLNAGFYYWNGSQWTQVGTGGSTGCVTLQQAYECNGVSSGGLINIQGNNPVRISASTANSIAFQATNSASGVAIATANTSSNTQYPTIQATIQSNNAQPACAVYGGSIGNGNAYAVRGDVASTSTAFSAIFGFNARTTGGIGVWGEGYNGIGGQSAKADGYGVWGANSSTTAYGIGTMGQGFVGVAGQTTDINQGYGLYSYDYAGINNDIDVGGNLNVSGTKNFRIDHPLYPDTKFLKHFCIESNEVLNMYRGVAEFDNNGRAVIKLPEYFNMVNTKFSYQLTAIGASMPELFIEQEIVNNQFIIAGGKKGGKVSWAVISERNDRILQENPELKDSEPLKQGRYAGKYINPEFFNKDKSTGLLFVPKHEIKTQETKNVMLLQND